MNKSNKDSKDSGGNFLPEGNSLPSDELRARMLDEVLEYSGASPARPGDIRPVDYARAWRERYGTSIHASTARSHLDRMVADGLLKRVRVVIDSRICMAYRKVEEKGAHGSGSD